MEFFGSIPFIAALAFLSGGLLGALGYHLVAPASRDKERLESQLSEVESDLESYKKSVTGHFNKTSALVNDLTEDYIKVYKHLAQGAQTLGDPKEIGDFLEQPNSKILVSFGEQEEGSEDDHNQPASDEVKLKQPATNTD